MQKTLITVTESSNFLTLSPKTSGKTRISRENLYSLNYNFVTVNNETKQNYNSINFK